MPGGEYSFVDANGKPHIFRAERGQEYRLWVDSPLKNEETGNDLTLVRQAGGGVPGAWAPVVQGQANGAFHLRGKNMQRTGVFLEERAPSVEDQSYMVSSDFSMDEVGAVKPTPSSAPYSFYGRVWSDAEGYEDRNETGPLYWDRGVSDRPIEGAKVYASVLSDAGIAEFDRLAIAKKPFREQAAATKEMIENMRANGKDPILKTVGAETNADGYYTIRMGNAVGDRMKNYTYIWAENDGKVLNSFSGFPTPVFQKVNANTGENPNDTPTVGILSLANHRWYNINFAEVQADIAHLDIFNYDSYLNPADLPKGTNNLEPAKVKLTGALPFSGDNKIRWIGPNGKQIGDDCPVDTLADAANCSLAPGDFATPGTYVAQLVNAYDVVVGQDSFIAVDKVRQNGEFEPQYEDATVPAGKKTTVEAPKDKDGKDIPGGTTFEPTGQVTDPKGNKIDKPDWITVKPDGTIEVKPPKDTKPGDYTIPVVVTYPDGSRETIEAKVTVKPAPSVDQTPVTVVEGQESDPFDTAENVPEGGKVEVDGLPGGLTVDPETGKVSGTPDTLDDWDKDEEERDVTVTVTITDKDGKEVAKEDKVITVQRDTDGDGDPDVTDKDDDGDGFTDEQEKKAGTDPKDPNSKPETPADPDTVAPTVDAIKPGDKTISGADDRPNSNITVELPGGKKVGTTTDKDGKWSIEVPADVELEPGQNIKVTDAAGNETPAKVGIDTGKCVATSLGFGLPLLALIPLGLASQIEIPGLSGVVADANAQLQAANTRIQQQLGLFNPEIAAQVDAANKQLAQFGADLGTVAAGLALIAAGILAGTLIYDNCSPEGGSSVKDLELKGSSGKTYAGSSRKDEKGAESGSSKKDQKQADKKDADKAGEKAADKK